MSQPTKPTSIRHALDKLRPIFAQAAVGNFSEDISTPSDDDDRAELYTGIQIMLEVIRSKIASLEYEKAHFKTLLSSIGEGILVIDQDNKIVLVNTIAQDLLGWTETEAMGKDYSQVVKLTDELGKPIEHNKQPFVEVLRLKRIIKSDSYYYKKGNGELVAVSITAAPIMQDRKIIGIINVLHNITQEKEIDRMKSEFISIAAHQLRTPLGIIRWNIELLMRNNSTKQGGEVHDFIDQAYPSTIRMIHLVNDLLNVSRIEQNKIISKETPVDTIKVIESVIQELVIDVKNRNITISILHPEQKLPLLLIDATQFQSMIQNLLWNAVKYNRPDGSITISVIYKERTFHIAVQDTGIGIPASDQAKLFTRFFRAENALRQDANGNGLGLYVVKKFAEYYGGSVLVSSIENKGSTFTLVLPQGGTIDKT